MNTRTSPARRGGTPLLRLLYSVWLSSLPFWGWGCVPTPADPKGVDAGPENGAVGTATKNTDSATQKTAPPSEAAKPPEKPPETTKKAIPDSIKALQEKIQPPNVSGQELPALVTTSDATIKSFVDAILAGKKEDAYKLLLGNKEYEEIVSEGLKSILGVGLIQHNKEVIDQLIESLQGQKLEKLEWKPGTAAYSKPPKTFRQRLPLISTSELLITVAGGVLIQLNVEQMIYHNNMWKVFRVTIP